VNPDEEGIANGPSSYWVRSEVGFFVLVVSPSHSRYIRLVNWIRMTKVLPTAPVHTGFAARLDFLLSLSHTFPFTLYQTGEVDPDDEGIANGPSSYWVRSKVGFFLFSLSHTCSFALLQTGQVDPDDEGIANGPNSKWVRSEVGFFVLVVSHLLIHFMSDLRSGSRRRGCGR
jgi:hypothetical protein